MNIHKFNSKPSTNQQSKTIKWVIPNEILPYVKKLNYNTWEIFAQEDIQLKPKEVKFLLSGVGFIMSEGVVLTSLNYTLTKKRVSLQNSVNLTDTINIIAVLTNNSTENIKIHKFSHLLTICHKKL